MGKLRIGATMNLIPHPYYHLSNVDVLRHSMNVFAAAF